MNRTEAEQLILKEFIPLLHKRFEEKWPDTFVIARSMDKEELTKANKSMYSWYMKMSNSLYDMPETPKYYQSLAEAQTGNRSYIKRMFEDFKEAHDWLAFMIEFVPLKN